MQDVIDQMTEELELAQDKALLSSNDYEDKISKLETELGKK